jgi:pentatricopeptide repeat protein
VVGLHGGTGATSCAAADAECVDAWRGAQARRGGLPASVELYTSLLRSFVQRGQLEDAATVLVEMQRDWLANADAQEILMAGLSKVEHRMVALIHAYLHRNGIALGSLSATAFAKERAAFRAAFAPSEPSLGMPSLLQSLNRRAERRSARGRPPAASAATAAAASGGNV